MKDLEKKRRLSAQVFEQSASILAVYGIVPVQASPGLPIVLRAKPVEPEYLLYAGYSNMEMNLFLAQFLIIPVLACISHCGRTRRAVKINVQARSPSVETLAAFQSRTSLAARRRSSVTMTNVSSQRRWSQARDLNKSRRRESRTSGSRMSLDGSKYSTTSLARKRKHPRRSQSDMSNLPVSKRNKFDNSMTVDELSEDEEEW